MSNFKLKDPQTCRIFFSSPFGGMEDEREELTRKYFPQIQHFCSQYGVNFVAVDMRWGITSEASSSSQVINICLRELDRSDFFAGFFGQVVASIQQSYCTYFNNLAEIRRTRRTLVSNVNNPRTSSPIRLDINWCLPQYVSQKSLCCYERKVNNDRNTGNLVHIIFYIVTVMVILYSIYYNCTKKCIYIYIVSDFMASANVLS